MCNKKIVAFLAMMLSGELCAAEVNPLVGKWLSNKKLTAASIRASSCPSEETKKIINMVDFGNMMIEFQADAVISTYHGETSEHRYRIVAIEGNVVETEECVPNTDTCFSRRIEVVDGAIRIPSGMSPECIVEVFSRVE